MRSVLMTALTAVGVVVIIVVLLAGMLWWRQESIVYQPPPPPRPASEGAGARRVEYRASDGQPLYGYLVADSAAAPGPSARRRVATVVVAFHGNADLVYWQLPWARELARRTGARVLLAEYRGYGGLDGSPSYEGLGRDARAAYAYARDTLGARPEAVVLYGHSLGAAVATELARALADEGTPPRALLLQSPFTSAREMGVAMFGRGVGLAWGAISRVHYDNERAVRDLPLPVSVAHGAADELIPMRLGRTVFDAARVKGALLVVPGAHHNDVEQVAGEEYWRWLEAGVAGGG
jgi:fermentation-respiration switch protein FrsA (DUF1100 family)